MDKISIQIERLKSPDRNTRYDACEELRVTSELSKPALDALEEATHDPDSEVADGATRALQVHQPHHALLRPKVAGSGDNSRPYQSQLLALLSPAWTALVVLIEFPVGTYCWASPNQVFMRTAVCQVLAGPQTGDALGTWGLVIQSAYMAIPASTLLGFLAAILIRRLSPNSSLILPWIEIAIGILTPVLVVAFAMH
jgi:hypothetical protein